MHYFNSIQSKYTINNSALFKYTPNSALFTIVQYFVAKLQGIKNSALFLSKIQLLRKNAEIVHYFSGGQNK